MQLYGPAILTAVVIVILEMTEVVALVFALSADAGSVRHGAAGAIAGTTVVAVAALGSAAVLISLPRAYLLWGSAVTLAAFGVFLFRSTFRSYRRAASPDHAPAPSVSGRSVQFAGGFTVGAVEGIEAVIVLLALTAAGYGFSAIVGAAAGGAGLVVAAALVHDRIRRIKVPWLKLGATGLLFSFAVFWGGEAAGVAWPGADLILILFFVVAVLVVRGVIAVLRPVQVQTKG